MPIELNSAVQESIDLVSFLYKQDGIELQSDLHAEFVMIQGNIGKLQQVLMNLLSNARDAMEQSSVKVISVQTRVEDEQAVIEVSDTGQGIKPKNLEKVFRRGYTTKPVGKGSGMGLDLVRRLVGDMGGSISVESDGTSGTTFRLIFPVFSPRPGM